MYSDSLIHIADSGLVLKNYYFPFGGAKSIPFKNIEKVMVLAPTVLNGCIRIWGGGPGVWFALDAQRPWRDALFRVVLKDSAINPAFSAQSSADVIQSLANRGVEVEIHGN